jgi:hypothetical protein
LFIHGNHKKSSTWNTTDHKKNINIEMTIGKKARTLMLQIDNYSQHPFDHINSLLTDMKQYK